MPARDSDNWQEVNWSAEKFTHDDWAAIQEAREILKKASLKVDAECPASSAAVRRRARAELNAVTAQLDVTARKVNGRVRNGW